METIQPPGWKAPRGYSNGVLTTGRLCFVAGQVGWNPATCAFERDDFAGQFAQALENVVAVVRAAGGAPAHLTRLTLYVTDKARYQAALSEVGAAYRRLMGKHYPAMALVQVTGLLEEGALVEIEATAVIP